MCNDRNKIKVEIKGKFVRIDRCIAKLIIKLNEDIGMTTYGSCCGHGRYPMTIIVASSPKKIGLKHEFCSGIQIPRTRRFYLKDKEGFYYIPEIQKLRIK